MTRTKYSVQICTNIKCDNYLGTIALNDADVMTVKYLSFLLVFAACMLYSPRNYCSSSPPVRVPVKTAVAAPAVYHKPLTIKNMEEEIYALDMVCPEVVLAQVKLESGNLTSRILRRSNNMFGMRYPMRRQTKAIGIYIPALDSLVKGPKEVVKKFAQYSSYAAYEKWEDAVADYKLWQEYTFKVNERYIDFLQKNYAEDSLYVQRVKILARKR
jgi:uncharacterized FlgJ-related protein